MITVTLIMRGKKANKYSIVYQLGGTEYHLVAQSKDAMEIVVASLAMHFVTNTGINPAVVGDHSE